MMSFILLYTLLVVAVIGVLANQLILRNELKLTNARISAISNGVRAARRGNVRERRTRARARPTIRNRELMTAARDISNINPDGLDQQQDA